MSHLHYCNKNTKINLFQKKYNYNKYMKKEIKEKTTKINFKYWNR